jgi:acetyl-CoA C-acetyltransferase
MSVPNVWLAAGLRTPFVKADGALRDFDAIEISVPVVQAMIAELRGASPDFAVWGTVLPNLTWSNIAREVMLDAKVDPTVPAFSTVMACSTSMMGVIEAAGMLNARNRTLALAGGSESLSQVQIGLSRRASNWLRGFTQARGGSEKLNALASLRPKDIGLYVPKVANRVTGMSMGEHMEVTAKEFASVTRVAQDQLALDSHQHAVAAWKSGFFDDLVIPFAGVKRDTIPRSDTSLEKLGRLMPAFDRTSGRGTITAGNASPLTDGAAGIWVATDRGLEKLPTELPRARLIDWEIASVDIWHEGLLMAPAYAIPRLLERNNLTYDDVALWEIHEAFAAQVLAHLEALEKHKDLGVIARERINPNGGSTALGHPFGATGARILSQAVKELAAKPSGSRAIVSICADGGQGSVALLQV